MFRVKRIPCRRGAVVIHGARANVFHVKQRSRLETILAWIRAGGLAESNRRDVEEAQAEERRKRSTANFDSRRVAEYDNPSEHSVVGMLLEVVGELFFRLR